MKIKSCLPPKALPGGVVRVELSGVKDPGALEARLGQISADILGASQSFLTVRIPEEGAGDLTIISEGREHVVPVVLGNALVDDLHPVACSWYTPTERNIRFWEISLIPRDLRLVRMTVFIFQAGILVLFIDRLSTSR